VKIIFESPLVNFLSCEPQNLAAFDLHCRMNYRFYFGLHQPQRGQAATHKELFAHGIGTAHGNEL
jgi:hypothetical protein